MEIETKAVKAGGGKNYVPIITAIILVFIFAWPRLLVGVFGIDSPWTSHLYKYGFGAVFFFTGVFIVLKNGACNLKRYQDRLWFRYLIIGFFWYLILHALWITASITTQFLGDK